MLAFPAPLRFGLLALTATLQAALPAPDPARLKVDLDYLCQPELTGRATGTAGAEQAAAYVANRMRDCGLVPIKPGGLGGVTPYHFSWAYSGEFRTGASAPPERRWSGVASDVVGVLPGTEPALAGEYVFVTAHFDHLGTSWGTLYPGADDNASGTAGLLELMRVLRRAQPRRSIAFLAVSGEEEGLLGSEAYLEHAPLPISTIKAELNLDMVGRGRKGELHVMPARQDGYVTTLTQDARQVAARHGVTLAAGIERHWQDSDHYSFAKRDIPSICFNTGLHEDYHQPTDTPDKIDFTKLSTVVAIVGELALTTANAPGVPAVLAPEVWRAWVWAPFESDLVPKGPCSSCK